MAYTFFPYLRLTRPVNGVIAGLSVLAGVFISGGDITGHAAVLAACSGWFLCAGANVLNDCIDVEIDRKNGLKRPLVTGAAKRDIAIVVWVIMYGAGIGLSTLVSLAHAGIAAIAILGTVMYNTRLKKAGFTGNLIAGGVASLAFLYGGLLGPTPVLALVPTFFAFFFHLGREILKDLEDVAGDFAGQVGSVPLRYGISEARTIITGTFVLLIIITIIPYILGWYGPIYLATVALVNGIIIYVLWSLWRDLSPLNAGRLSRILKVDMVIGLIAVCLGR